jgi:carboxypeptidase Taq
MEESLQYILDRQRELSIFGGIAALLGWDQMTYMPPQGTTARSHQSALISRLSHERIISDTLWNHLQYLSKRTTFDRLAEHEKIIVNRLKKDVKKARKIPSAFVERFVKVTTLAYPSWQQARITNTFSLFAPYLTQIIDLEKEYCTYIDLPGPCYNSLLDDYEEGITVDVLQHEFQRVKQRLKQLLERLSTSPYYDSQKEFIIPLSPDKQRKLCNYMKEVLMLPPDRSRMDVSTHPFTTALDIDDVRITTNFERSNSLFSFFSTIHESGHALYELGMPQQEYKDTVISDSPSLGMHESQSRFWENMIARSESFWHWLYPRLKKMIPGPIAHLNAEALYHGINQVKPSLIRVEADELTYGLHVILRFELELALLEESLDVKDLPEVWKEKMEDFLGIRPTTDTEGVLQDMHWSGGSIGYFPTYLIGSIYAAQLFHQLKQEHPSLDEDIQQGTFSSILTWLRDHVHQYGRMMTADEIIQRACGEGLNATRYLTYLEEKYCPLYGV